MTYKIPTLIPVSRPQVGEEELSAVQEVFLSHWLGMGAQVKKFEDAISEFLGGDPRSEVIAVNTGTTALHLTLEAIGVGPGDEVIVPSLTFVAIAQAIASLGATPVFCEVEETTLNPNVQDAMRCFSSRTKAVVPVHYRGMPCDLGSLLPWAKEHRLRVVEDAAHAFGSHHQGQRIGSFGDITCFSFDPIKNITCGEGGAIVTRDRELAECLRRKRILGIDKDTWSRYHNQRVWFYDVMEQGFRYHMSNINAAIGLTQLSKFDRMNHRKIAIAQRYDESFSKLPGIHLLKTNYDGLALFTYIIRIVNGERDQLMEFLKEQGVDSGVHYIPVHHFSHFQKFATRALPTTDKLYQQIVTLPLFPDMTDSQTEQVIRSVVQWFNRSSA